MQAVISSHGREYVSENQQRCNEKFTEHCGWFFKKFQRKPGEKERMKQFSIYFEEIQTARDREYIRRRSKRKEKRKEHKQLTGRIPYLHIPIVILFMAGAIILLMGVYKPAGKNTYFWKHKMVSYVLGSSCIFGSFCLLLVTEGIKHWYKKQGLKTKEVDVKEVLMQQKRDAVKQIPCIHQERMWKIYKQNGYQELSSQQITQAYANCHTSLDSVNVSYDDTSQVADVHVPVNATSQTDEDNFMRYLEERFGNRGSFRTKKHPLSKQESVGSFSVTSSGTQYTDPSDWDEETQLIREKEPFVGQYENRQTK